MIKTTDLRLGNLIKHNSPWKSVQRLEVIELKKGGVIITKDLNNLSFGTFEEDAEGIPLTPEIWNKTFSPFFTSETFRKLDFSIHKTSGLIEFKNIPIKEVKTVHELQNLYFTLTGDELNINL